jgi:hypothetical protein
MKRIMSAFELTIYDPRFPTISVRNDGTSMFHVVKGNKTIDSFDDAGIAGRGQIKVDESEHRAREFFQRLSEHPWLYEAYLKL